MTHQSRVKSSIDVVQAVQDLKTAIANLDVSIQRRDWEAATRAMQRARAIDPDIVKSGFAEAVVVSEFFDRNLFSPLAEALRCRSCLHVHTADFGFAVDA